MIIRQKYIFSSPENPELLGDLARLKLVIESIPDEKLIKALYNQRKNGRNDHPIEAMWNSIIAGIVYEHPSIESLIRELDRNGQLRELCGFNPLMRIPSKSAYNRFLKSLFKYQELIDEMFNGLVNRLKQLVPDLGKNINFDGKAIKSFGKDPGEIKKDGDRRREEDANWGVKKYNGVNKDGSNWEKTISWFGFKLHIIADADLELPLSYSVKKASESEQNTLVEMFNNLSKKHPEILENCEHGIGDKGYDSIDILNMLLEKNIKPIIDIRNMWKDKEKTRTLNNSKIINVSYDYKGTVFCHCMKTGKIQEMAFGGFEKGRKTLKYLCPALHYGINCEGSKMCHIFNKSIRIPLQENPRVFTPVARSSYKWKKLYNKRTSVERINSRIETSFGFGKHFIKGLKKMTLRCGLALIVMLAIAVGRLQQKQAHLMRSLVKTA